MDLEFFRSAHIVFYTLILGERDYQNSLENGEFLGDFLENKICLLLNLPHESEYFFQYALAKDTTAYHCVLLDKKPLRDSLKNVNAYLTHPCFLCTQFLEESEKLQVFLVLDIFLEWTLVAYQSGKIVFLQTLDTSEVPHKLEKLKQQYGDFSFLIWRLKHRSVDKEFLEKIKEEFCAREIKKNLEEIELPEDYNFNPIEKTTPFLKSKTGGVAQGFSAGIVLGCLVCLIMLGIEWMATIEIKQQKGQIQALQEEIQKNQESQTSAEKRMIQLQETLESLQMQYDLNASLLQNFSLQSILPASFLKKLNPFLEKHNVKIAYFGIQNDSLQLLFIGEETLNVLELLESQALGNIQTLESYNNFIWVEILPNIEVKG